MKIWQGLLVSSSQSLVNYGQLEFGTSPTLFGFLFVGDFWFFLSVYYKRSNLFFDIHPSINFSEIENAKAKLTAFSGQEVLPGHQSK